MGGSGMSDVGLSTYIDIRMEGVCLFTIIQATPMPPSS